MLENELLNWLATNLVRFGPGVLFVVCLLETAIFAGLILPVGALIAASAMLSSRGVLDPSAIIMAAFFGALIGDQLGFTMGRWFVASARPARGKIAKVWSATLLRTEALIRNRGLAGISVARAVPFVRTLMPWFAGRSGVSWGRFFFYDLLGVLLWGTIYIGGGFLAGEGWRQIAGRYGELAGAAAAALLVLLFLFLTRGWLLQAIRRWTTRA